MFKKIVRGMLVLAVCFLSQNLLYAGGWPVQVGGNVYTPPTLADIDGDGNLEVIVGVADDDNNPENGFNGVLHIWDHEGRPLPGWPQVTPGHAIRGSRPAAGDLIPEYKGLEVAVGSRNKKLYIWHADGTPVPGWPKTLPRAIFSPIIFADLDGDGKLEVLTNCTVDKKVYAWDARGNSLPGWPAGPSGDRLFTQDLDGDGKLEVISGSYIWNYRGRPLPGWPKEGFSIQVISRMDSAFLPGQQIVATLGKEKITLLNMEGEIMPGAWPVKIEGRGRLTVGNINNDGRQEIVVSSMKDGFAWMYAIQADGKILPGWPVHTNMPKGYPVGSEPVLKDVDGDGFLEIFVGHSCYSLHGWRHDGRLLEGFPVRSIGMMFSAPAIGDLDGDGHLEIVFGTGSAISQQKVGRLRLPFPYRKRGDLKPTPEEKQRGYVLYQLESPFELVTYEHRPWPEQRTQEISLFASPGEFEPATFSLYALRELGDIEISASNLRGEKGEIIPADNIDLRVVKVWKQITRCEREMYLVPELLLKDDRVKLAGWVADIPPQKNVTTDIPPGTSKQFFATVKVPSDVQPGLYRGTIRIRPENAPESNIVLKVNVLPIKLLPPAKTYAIFYHGSSFGLGWWGEKDFPEEVWEKKALKELIDLRERGFTSVSTLARMYGSTEGGKLTLDFRPLERSLRLHQEAGLTGPTIFMPWYARIDGRDTLDMRGYGWGRCPKEKRLFFYTLEEVVRQIVEFVEENQFPPIYFYGVDEPIAGRPRHGMECKVDYAKRTFEAIRRGGGRTTSALYRTCWGGWETLGPLADLPIYRCGTVGSPEEMRKEAKEKGQVWNYPMIWYENPTESRLRVGYVLWRSGLTGVMPWCYMSTFGSKPFDEQHLVEGEDDLSGVKGMYAPYPSLQGPIPTLTWEAVREGIDDVRYLTTLSELIKKERCPQKRQRAEKAKNRVLDKIDLNVPIALATLSPADLQRLRWEIVEAIKELTK